MKKTFRKKGYKKKATKMKRKLARAKNDCTITRKIVQYFDMKERNDLN